MVVSKSSVMAILFAVVMCCICLINAYPTPEDKSSHDYHFGYGIKGKGEYAGHYDWKDKHGYGSGASKGKGEAEGYASIKGTVHSVVHGYEHHEEKKPEVHKPVAHGYGHDEKKKPEVHHPVVHHEHHHGYGHDEKKKEGGEGMGIFMMGGGAQ